MSDKKPSYKDVVRVMVNEIIADMLDMSDDEILKEADEVESVSDEDLEKARSIYQKASRIAARERLRQAREALLEHKSSSGKGGKIIDIAMESGGLEDE